MVKTCKAGARDAQCQQLGMPPRTIDQALRRCELAAGPVKELSLAAAQVL